MAATAMRIQVKGMNIMGTDRSFRERTGREQIEQNMKREQNFQNTQIEQRRRRRVQRLRRERLQKCLAFGLTMAAVLCMILICTVSYGSIRAQANTGFKYYTGVTVESGETLWGIADRYIDYDHYEDKDSYIAEIESINHLDMEDALWAGQFLVVPYYSAEYIP